MAAYCNNTQFWVPFQRLACCSGAEIYIHCHNCLPFWTVFFAYRLAVLNLQRSEETTVWISANFIVFGKRRGLWLGNYVWVKQQPNFQEDASGCFTINRELSLFHSSINVWGLSLRFKLIVEWLLPGGAHILNFPSQLADLVPSAGRELCALLLLTVTLRWLYDTSICLDRMYLKEFLWSDCFKFVSFWAYLNFVTILPDK